VGDPIFVKTRKIALLAEKNAQVLPQLWIFCTIIPWTLSQCLRNDAALSEQESRGRTAWCRWKFRYLSNFTTASCSFSATAWLSCIPYISDCTNADITHSRPTLIFMAMTLSRKSWHTTNIKKSYKSHVKVMVIMNTWLPYSSNKCYSRPKCFCLRLLGLVSSRCKIYSLIHPGFISASTEVRMIRHIRPIGMFMNANSKWNAGITQCRPDDLE